MLEEVEKMMRKIFLVVMIFALILLVACKPIEKPVDNTPEKNVPASNGVMTKSISDTSQESSSSVSSSASDEKSGDGAVVPSVSGACTPSWKCIGDFNKAYLMANCTWKDNTKCKYGCVDGECKKPPVCVSGFKCRTDKVFGYESEGCYWSKEETCELGCKDNACVKPVVTAANNDTVQVNPYAVQNKTSDCEDGWKCFDNDYSVFQDSYCTLNGKSYCAKGCVEGKCVK